MRERTKILKGDRVRFRPQKLHIYRQVYDVTADDVLSVVHVEARGGKRALYLEKTGRVAWIPAWPSALLLVDRAAQ